MINMMSERMKKLILPYLKMELEEHEWKYMEYMLSEAYYYVDEDGEEVIGIQPSPVGEPDISLFFSAVNGAAIGIEFWSIIQQKGLKL